MVAKTFEVNATLAPHQFISSPFPELPSYLANVWDRSSLP